MAEPVKVMPDAAKAPLPVDLLRAAFDAVADGVLIIDVAGESAFVNGPFIEMWGIPEHVATSGRYRAMVDIALDVVADPVAFAGRLRQVDPESEQTAVIALKDGRFLELRGRPLRVAGALAGRVVISRDVTEGMRVDRMLRESEQKYRSLYNRTPIMMHSIDREGRLVSVSDAWLERLGYERAEVIGRRSIEFLTEDSARIAREVVLPAFFDSGTCIEVPYELVTKSGKIIDVLLSAIAERDDDGTISRSQAVLVDITRRKRAEAERDQLLHAEREARLAAQEAVRLRDEFIAVASHELRTPITPVKMQLQLILRHLRSGEFATYPHASELANLVEGADLQLERLAALIEAMLDASIISAGGLELRLEEVALDCLVRREMARLAPEAARAGCELIVDGTVPVWGRWDPRRLERAVKHIVCNAIRYGRGKPIDVAVSSANNVARLVVRDRGIGIAPEELAHVFERFRRGVSWKAYGGLGLGLHIAHEIVAAHEGTISVDSEPGAGATFTVTLPLDRR